MRDILRIKQVYLILATLLQLICQCTFAFGRPTPYEVGFYHSVTPINLARAVNLPFRSFVKSADLPVFDKHRVYLFRLKLNDPVLQHGAVLFIENEHLDTVSLYKRAGNSLVLLQRKGNDFPEAHNRIGCPDFDLPAGTQEYYVLTTFKKEISFPLTVRTISGMERWATGVFFQLGLYYGVCIMFLIFNLCLFFYLSDRLYLYYALFLTFIVLSIAYADGLFTFMTNSSWLLNHSDMILHFGLGLSGAQFARRFLDIAVNRTARSISVWVLAMILAGDLLSLILDWYIPFLIADTMVLALLCYYWVLALKAFKLQVHARFFVIGYGVFLVFAIDFFVLRKFGFFALELYLGQLKTGSLIEMIVLTIAIMYRIRALNEQNAQYRSQIDLQVRNLRAEETRVIASAANLFSRIQKQYDLSDRETEVLRGITDGLTNQQIAERLFISIHTVKFHTRSIFEKLEITNRTQALSKLLPVY